MRTWECSLGCPFVVQSLTVRVAGVSVLHARYREHLFGAKGQRGKAGRQGGDAVGVLSGDIRRER